MVQPSPRKRSRKPLDQPMLQALALAYAARYATTESRLRHYLGRKLAERGWEGNGEADIEAIVIRMRDLRYVDDLAFAQNRSQALDRRGFGAGRIKAALVSAGVAPAAREAITAQSPQQALDAARRFAKRRHFGPFGLPPTDPKAADRQLAAMIRAGHSFEIARAVLEGRDEEWRHLD